MVATATNTTAKRQTHTPTGQTWRVVEHMFARNRKTMFSTLLSGIVSPVLTFLALGYGLGSQIEDTSSLGTDDYLLFVGPGILVGSAIMQGGFANLWQMLGMLKWEGTYKTIVHTPTKPVEIAKGHYLFIGLRVAGLATIYLIVLLIAVGWRGPLALLTPLVAGLTAVSFGSLIGANSARSETDAHFPLISRLVITPLFIFSGTFTAVDTLPVALQALIKVTPGYHGIELGRDLVNGTAALGSAVLNLAVLIGWATVGVFLTVRGFRKTLTA